MKNNLTHLLLKLTASLVLMLAVACSGQVSPTVVTQPAPTQTTKPTETKPSLTATRTRRVKATNTPVNERALPSVTLAQNARAPTSSANTPPANQSQTITLTPLAQGAATATFRPPTLTLRPSTTSEYTEAASPTGPTPTLTITLTPTPIQNSGPLDLQDGLGRTVHLPGTAMKVVSLAPSNTEIMYEVGGGTQMVGRDDFSDYPEDAYNDLPSVGGTNGVFDLNAITNLHPDLVLMAGLNDQNLVADLVSRGLTVFYVANPANLNGMYNNMRSVAKMTGHSSEAEALINTYGQRMAALAEVLAPITTHPKVFIELDGTDQANPWTCGPGSYLDTMVTLAGGQNIGAIMPNPWGKMSTAQIAAQNPDIIILADSLYGMTPDDIAARPGWEDILAVQDFNIFAFDDSGISRPGPRLLDGVEALAYVIHPEIFQLP